MLWQIASSQSPCGVRMLIECNHRNPHGLAPGSSQFSKTWVGRQRLQKEIQEYRKKFSKGILSRFIQEGDEKQAVEFVKTGFVSQNTLKEMMLRAKENNMVSLQAYILEQLNVDKANLENFRI